MGKSERFGLVLTVDERAALQQLADNERLPAAAVVRRLIWDAAHETAPRRGMRSYLTGRARNALQPEGGRDEQAR